MSENDPIDPAHAAKQFLLRFLGVVVLIVGIIFMIAGGVDFFSTMGTFEPPRLFWCFFVGMPLIAVGGGMTSMGFMGAVARYNAAEIAPVGADTANYIAPRVGPAVRSLSRDIAEGIEDAGDGVFCTHCGQRNEADANFCKKCGRPMR